MNSEAQKFEQLGNDAFKKRDFATALENYGKAIELEPTEITYYLNIAAVHFEMKNYTECVNTCNKAIDVGRENRADFKLIAKALDRMEKAQMANNSAENRNASSEIESAMKNCHVEEEKMENLYKVVPIEGKGIGCVALKDIKKGTLIVREKAPIVVKNTNDVKANYQTILDSFFSMTKDDQEEFLKLKYPNSEMLKKMKISRQSVKEFVQNYSHPGADRKKLIDIVVIFLKNLFWLGDFTFMKSDGGIDHSHSGVFLKAAKFNHSCAANTDGNSMDNGRCVCCVEKYKKSTEENVMELRANSNIMTGQEITMGYINVKGMNYKARQEILLTECQFECICERCQKEARE